MSTTESVNGVLEHPETASTPPDGGEVQGITRDAATPSKLLSELDELKSTLTLAREALDAAERRHAIELELLRADAVDLETARLMTQAAVAGMASADVAEAVSDLRRRKPFLFRKRTTPSAMGGSGTAPSTPAERLAQEARESGDRRSLLRYLRARRG